jgi:hypothetical protein
MWLDGHILIADGCDGQRKSNECPLDHITREYTEQEHAEMLRQIIRNKDSAAMDAFFDYKTGPYHKKARERLNNERKLQNKDD